MSFNQILFYKFITLLQRFIEIFFFKYQNVNRTLGNVRKPHTCLLSEHVL